MLGTRCWAKNVPMYLWLACWPGRQTCSGAVKLARDESSLSPNRPSCNNPAKSSQLRLRIARQHGQVWMTTHDGKSTSAVPPRWHVGSWIDPTANVGLPATPGSCAQPSAQTPVDAVDLAVIPRLQARKANDRGEMSRAEHDHCPCRARTYAETQSAACLFLQHKA